MQLFNRVKPIIAEMWNKQSINPFPEQVHLVEPVISSDLFDYNTNRMVVKLKSECHPDGDENWTVADSILRQNKLIAIMSDAIVNEYLQSTSFTDRDKLYSLDNLPLRDCHLDMKKVLHGCGVSHFRLYPSYTNKVLKVVEYIYSTDRIAGSFLVSKEKTKIWN